MWLAWYDSARVSVTVKTFRPATESVSIRLDAFRRTSRGLPASWLLARRRVQALTTRGRSARGGVLFCRYCVCSIVIIIIIIIIWLTPNFAKVSANFCVVAGRRKFISFVGSESPHHKFERLLKVVKLSGTNHRKVYFANYASYTTRKNFRKVFSRCKLDLKSKTVINNACGEVVCFW